MDPPKSFVLMMMSNTTAAATSVVRSRRRIVSGFTCWRCSVGVSVRGPTLIAGGVDMAVDGRWSGSAPGNGGFTALGPHLSFQLREGNKGRVSITVRSAGPAVLATSIGP